MIKNVLQNKNVLSLLTNVSIAAFGLFGFLLLSRSLNKEEFGTWILYVTASGLVEMMRFGLTKVAIIKFLLEYKQMYQMQQMNFVDLDELLLNVRKCSVCIFIGLLQPLRL